MEMRSHSSAPPPTASSAQLSTPPPSSGPETAVAPARPGSSAQQAAWKRARYALVAALLVVLALTIYVVGNRGGSAAGSSATETSGPAPTQPPSLAGVWKQSNSSSSDSYQEATITGSTIEINWVSDGGDTKSLYWAGSFTPPTSATESYRWTSKNDKSKTDTALLASGDATKDFTYQDGTISYSASALGTTTTIRLKRR